MKVSKNIGIAGEWLDKKTLRSGDLAKLVTEAKEVEREYEGEKSIQLVAKIKIKGQEGEKNVAINMPTKSGLIDAFGDDTKDWLGKTLAVEVESGRFGGKKGIALYLIPEGFELGDDNGYVVIVKRGKKTPEQKVSEHEREIAPEDIPF